MSPKDACEKWKAPRRRLRQWLIEYDRGDYADLGSLYTMEELKKRTRLKGGGAKVKDQVLEEKLVTYYNQLRDELYPITTELLAYECLTRDEKFLGGSSSPTLSVFLISLDIGAKETTNILGNQQALGRSCQMGTRESGKHVATTFTLKRRVSQPRMCIMVMRQRCG